LTKILVVDDDSEMTKLLDTFLTGEGHEVLVAADGGAAVRATSSMEPDLVLLDIVLGYRGRSRRPARTSTDQ
jgi:DNA-binding response OmpR family regulator